MATNKPTKPKGNRLSSRQSYTDEDIDRAINDHHELGLSIRACARKHGMPESTLRHKISGYHPVSKKMGPKTLLTEAEEQVLVNYVKVSCDRAHPVTKDNILNAVSKILTEERGAGYPRVLPPSFKEDTPRQKWWRLFKKRHPTITMRTPETLSTARKNISKQVIHQWFEDAYQYFADIDALDALQDPSRNFNIDESGFSLSPKQGRVLAIKGEKLVFEESSAKQKCNITVLGNICADGRVPPPMIIYPRKRINPLISEQFPEDCEFIVGKSEKGYITYETLYEFLCNGFNDWVTAQGIQRPVIVWTDWHETRNNYFLSKTLNEQNIILYGLPPNTTHFMQPLDVSVFGPLKKGWAKTAKAWELEHNDEPITQINFAKVFLPAYFKYVKPENIKSGFSKCGLVPYNSDSPDYSKLAACAAQKASGSSIFEGVDQGGKVEVSCQTVQQKVLHRGIQTAPIMQVTTAFERRDQYQYKGSLCDMVIDCKQHSHLLKQYQRMPFHATPPILEFQRSPPPTRPTSRQSPIHDEPLELEVDVDIRQEDIDEPLPGTSRDAPHEPDLESPPQASRGQSPISSFFLQHQFYPERRPGKGPKIIRNVLDRVFSISSHQMRDELKRQKDEKEGQKTKKRKTPGTSQAKKASKPTKKPKNKARPAHRVDEESSTSEDDNEAVSLHDSSDASIDLDDGGDFGIKLPLIPAQFDSFVGVRVEKSMTASKTRVQKHLFQVYVGKVIGVDDEGLTVSFLREKSNGFYYFPEVEDVSHPILQAEVVVLEEPPMTVKARLEGFQFPTAIIASIISYFNNRD